MNIEEAAIAHKEKLSQIKLFLTDVDGILTDGIIQWQGSEVGWNRSFNVRDGYGIKMLQEMGIKVGFISGGKSRGLEERVKLLGLEKFSALGNEDKREGYLQVVQRAGVKDNEVLYIGDEYFDMPLLKRAGFSATVKNASPAVKEVCDYVCDTPSGHGCVRELIDMIAYLKKWRPYIEDFK